MDKGKRLSRRLSFDDAVEVWIKRWEGWYQHRIAASFDVNSGRINEVLKGQLHQGSYDVAKMIYKRSP